MRCVTEGIPLPTVVFLPRTSILLHVAQTGNVAHRKTYWQKWCSHTTIRTHPSTPVLPHCWEVVGSGTPSVHCHTAAEQWAVDPLQYTATLLESSQQWISFGTLPHCWGTVDHLLHSAGELWAVDLLPRGDVSSVLVCPPPPPLRSGPT